MTKTIVEYCFPPLANSSARVTDDDLPPQWRHLSSLALPDGAHNYEKDTVFFHLPCNENVNRTVYGVSCYRQIAADKLKNKTEDVTRSTVQKSVCVVSALPLYGLLKAKLELITQAYFNQCDFDKVELLSEMYEHLKCSITKDLLQSQGLLGLSVRDLMQDFHHRVLVLFKLILLEKRVLFFGCPVYKLCHHILALLSLFPRMIEYGLVESAYYTPTTSLNATEGQRESSDPECGVDAVRLCGDNDVSDDREDGLLKEIEEALDEKYNTSGFFKRSSDAPPPSAVAEDCNSNLNRLKSHADNYGFPLNIFAKGSLCHPYLSLVYLDLLKSDAIRSYVFGATNALYKQRKDLVDVIVTIEEGVPRIDILDPDLKKLLSLTTADLRFMDNILKNVTQSGDVFIDYTAWEGGDEWIRWEFKNYLLAVMATAKSSDVAKSEDFNEAFVNAWSATYNYRVWACGHYADADGAVPGHPYRGQLSMADMKLRLSHSIQSSEQGRKINQTVSQTGKYISQTGKAVGGAVRSALNVWFQGSPGNEIP